MFLLHCSFNFSVDLKIFKKEDESMWVAHVVRESRPKECEL